MKIKCFSSVIDRHSQNRSDCDNHNGPQFNEESLPGFVPCQDWRSEKNCSEKPEEERVIPEDNLLIGTADHSLLPAYLATLQDNRHRAKSERKVTPVMRRDMISGRRDLCKTMKSPDETSYP